MSDILLTEFLDWKTLLSMPEWRRYVNLLEEHAEYLLKEVNRCTREGDSTGAQKFLAQKDLIPKLLGKVKDRVKTIKEKDANNDG